MSWDLATHEVTSCAQFFRPTAQVDNPDFFGLAPGKTAGLRYGGFVTVLLEGGVEKDADGNVSGLRATYDHARTGDNVPGGPKKVRAVCAACVCVCVCMCSLPPS